MKLNEKIIKLRKEHNLSQEDLGNAINASRQAVSKWETEQTKPDIDKIKEIAKLFDVTFDYLLNDEIDEITQKETEEKVEKTKVKKDRKILLKIIFIILMIYLLFSLYKFIALYRFYLIANSFSEENYSMFHDWTSTNGLEDSSHMSIHTEKYKNKLIEYSYWYEGSDIKLDEEGFWVPNQVNYTDSDKKIYYRINYNEDIGKYTYYDKDIESYTNEEKAELFNLEKNLIKENTLSYIPSNVKEIMLSSLNPMCFVSIFNREILTYDLIHDAKAKITLNNDYLVETAKYKLEFDALMSSSFSYDYVPDHQKDFKEPTEKYKDKIENIDEIK